MPKKAISPLIGAILIVGFTVAIAAVVMFWSSGFIKTTTTSTEEKVTEQVTLLRDLEMKVRDASVNLTDSTVRIKIENKNEKRIEGFIVKLYGTEGTFTNDTIDVPLDALEIMYIIVGYNGSIGNITKIEVIPKIIVSQKEIAATLQSDEFIAPAITGAAPSGEFVADANTVLLFHFDKDSAQEGEAKEYNYDSSMVGWWHLNGDALDSSGKGNDGVVNGATLTSGKFGNAYAFDGIDDFINLSSLPLSGTTYTVEAWFNSNKAGASNMIFAQRSSTSSNPIMGQLYLTSSNIAFITRNDANGNSALAQGTTALQNNTWYHAVGVRNGANVYVYLNGVLEGTDNDAGGTITTDTKEIGRYTGGATNSGYFSGTIDEIAIYNRSLSNPEIAQHVGILAKDYSNYGNNGTIQYKADWTSAGKFNSAIDFDYGYIDATKISSSGDITFEAWIYPINYSTSPKGHNQRVFHNYDGTNDLQLILSESNLLRWGTATGSAGADASVRPPLNTWTHIAVTRSGSTYKIYYNGIEQSIVFGIPGNPNPTTQTLRIGADIAGTGSNGHFTGIIDEVRISNIARTY